MEILKSEQREEAILLQEPRIQEGRPPSHHRAASELQNQQNTMCSGKERIDDYVSLQNNALDSKRHPNLLESIPRDSRAGDSKMDSYKTIDFGLDPSQVAATSQLASYRPMSST